MQKIIMVAFLLIGFTSTGSFAQGNDILSVISSSKKFSRLQDALKNADFSNSLKESGEYTFFAPGNLAFDKLAPSNTIDELSKTENKEKLRETLSYLILKDKIDLAKLTKLIKEGKGKTSLTTLGNAKIEASLEGKK